MRSGIRTRKNLTLQNFHFHLTIWRLCSQAAHSLEVPLLPKSLGFKWWMNEGLGPVFKLSACSPRKDGLPNGNHEGANDDRD